MRKRKTREHIIADLRVNHLERFLLQDGHVPIGIKQVREIMLDFVRANRARFETRKRSRIP